MWVRDWCSLVYATDRLILEAFSEIYRIYQWTPIFQKKHPKLTRWCLGEGYTPCHLRDKSKELSGMPQGAPKLNALVVWEPVSPLWSVGSNNLKSYLWGRGWEPPLLSKQPDSITCSCLTQPNSSQPVKTSFSFASLSRSTPSRYRSQLDRKKNIN